jgi:hypothetical protein
MGQKAKRGTEKVIICSEARPGTVTFEKRWGFGKIPTL